MRPDYSLADKYELERGAVYMTGIQALVRLPLEQMRRDRRAGLSTGCFISGYEGSPLGGYDLALQQVPRVLEEHNVVFTPGVNEDLAAGSIAGSQFFDLLGAPKVDGVVGIWYGKGPGVDRSGDALRHANLAGTGRNSGALLLAGDDHTSKSSTIPHQSELSLYNVGIPILAAGSTQEVLDFGLYGIALSRYCGSWAAMKLATDVCDGGGVVELSPERCPIVEPEFLIDGRPYRKQADPMLLPPRSLELEREMLGARLEAARRFAHANGLNRIAVRGDRDRVGLVSAGKAYRDLRAALADCGLDDTALEAAGIRILQIGMAHPLEPRIVDEFIEGLETLIVVEEKRSFIELQLRELLYNRARRPAVYGKTGPDGGVLFPADGELTADRIARALAPWLGEAPGVAGRVERILAGEARFPANGSASTPPSRSPSYCSGCPHNRSTLLLEGQVAGGGIGCHAMSVGLDDERRAIRYMGHMGSEGAYWLGMAPFTERRHVFQNIGDGTFFHSGRMALNAAVAAGVNVTFKILYNGAVAMTGGQQAAGAIGIPALTRELEADGAWRVVVLTDDLDKYRDHGGLAKIAELRPRDALETVLAEIEKVDGVSVLIYDQMCAAEKRRRRNRGKLPQPVRRLMIDERVCEGCGDCVTRSNCVSLEPVETEYGPKTRIHQSSCNVDYSCLLGDCPSFVSVELEEGSGLRSKAPTASDAPPATQEPSRPALERPYRILMPGVGGTGVVTVNAVLATAALLDGLHAQTLDQTGLAQKGGAVVSHLTVSEAPLDGASRIGAGQADLLLAFDTMGAATAENLRCADPERSAAVVNTHQTLAIQDLRSGLTTLSGAAHWADLLRQTTADALFLDASRLAEALFGGHVLANVFLLGAAYQAGRIPVSSKSIERALHLNGVAVERNLAAFRWGRAYVADPERVRRLALGEPEPSTPPPLGELIESRAAELVAYQNASYAEAFRSFVESVRQAERTRLGNSTALTEAVARNLFKLMAYKDEYEVARLLVNGDIERQAAATFAAPRRIVYHLHPPVLRYLGVKRKLRLGPWFKPVLSGLAKLKALRGTPLDPFGALPARRQERELIGWYRGAVEALLPTLSAETLETALAVARSPQDIRGYESVKSCSAERVKAQVESLLKRNSRPAAA